MLKPPAVKLAFRTDREAGIVRAYVADLDGDKVTDDIATINVNLLDKDPELWKDWKAALSAAFVRMLNSLPGVTVAKLEELHPNDLEGEPQG